MKKPKKKFLKLPEYPGGKEAFRTYIKSNLMYPKEAKENRVEGIVHLNADIDDNGNVIDVIVEKPLGAGCDEEAVRLIKAVQFGKVKNRGMRVKTRKKFRIEFKLPPQKKINYTVVKSDPNLQSEKNTITFSYSVRF